MKKYRRRLQAVSLVAALALAFTQTLTADATRSVSEIQKEQDELQDEIDGLDSELYDIVSQIQELEDNIAATEAEIEDTQASLEEAQIACDEQYEDMKIRIKYMYEKEDDNVFEMLIESGSISDFLNRVEYVNDVYSYDRQKLDQFEATQAEIEDLAAALDEQMEQLSASKADLETQEASLDAMIDEKKGSMKNLEAELKEAKEIAAREAALRAAQAAANGGGVTSAVAGYHVDGDLNPAQTTSISGSSVVSYAQQFVGCPYVWGGTSLTNGCDCSGFVMEVYRNFGFDWGTRMTSGSFRSVGQEVSYKYLQPGDIVCYPGHVAIYSGNGLIVEAQSTATGITNYRPVNCHPIVCIRRVI